MKYVGTFKVDQYSGQGTIEYADGATYAGAWARGVREGQGKLTSPDGNVFEGEWLAGQFVQGTIVFASRSNPAAAMRYEGAFKDGVPSGIGTMIYKNGTYSGSWLHGRYHGQGQYRGSDGEEYTGDWVAGQRSGRGDMSRPRSGDPGALIRYVGEFKDNAPHGEGTMHFANGARYTGGVMNYKPHGYGELLRPDGRYVRGRFDQSRPIGEDPR